MGGVIAFEMAQQLEAAGHDVARLVLIDSYTPDALFEYEKRSGLKKEEIFMMLKDIEGILGVKIPLKAEESKRIVKEALPEDILQRISELGVMPSGTDAGQMKRLFNVFKANNEAMENYKPRYYSGKAVLLSAAEKPVKIKDTSHGWGEFIYMDNLTIRQIPGDHYSIFREPAVSVLAEEINLFLAKGN